MERLEFERLPVSEVSGDQSLCGSGEEHRHSPDSCGDDSSYDGFNYAGQRNGSLPSVCITDHILGRRNSRKQRHTDRTISEGGDCGDVAVLEIHREELSEIDRKITLADGGSDDTVDGVTDHEDLHTEDDCSRPQSTSGSSCHGSVKGSALGDKQQQQQSVVRKQSLGTACVPRGRGAASRLLRRGWSSSAKSFVDIKGDRSAREDHAVRARPRERKPADGGYVAPARGARAAF